MKTYLSDKQLNHFKEKLIQLKKETENMIATNSRKSPEDSLEELSKTSNHPGDLGTEQFEQQRDAGLEQKHKKELIEIEAALERIDNNSFGISEKSGKPIPLDRLEAMPTARFKVDEE